MLQVILKQNETKTKMKQLIAHLMFMFCTYLVCEQKMFKTQKSYGQSDVAI